MYKRRYILKTFLIAVGVLIIPPTAFWVIVGHYFPPDGSWNWFFWILVGLGTWAGFLAAVAQLLGSSLPQWIGWDVLHILSAFEKTTSRTLTGVRDKLPVLHRQLERSEAEEVQECLEQGRPVLIEGESGSGKSGIAAALVRQYTDRGVPTLFLDTRNYSSAVSGFGDLEHYVGVESPLRDCLERVANRVGDCLLMIDQLDSAVGKPAFQVSTELLAAVAALGRGKVVGVSCVLETTEYEAVRSLRFDVVASRPLDRPTVHSLLQEMEVTAPSEAVLRLSENLLCLSLVVELAAEVDVGQMEGEATLFEKYRRTLHRFEGPEFIETVADLAYVNLPAGMVDFSLPHVPEGVFQRLQSRGIIIPASHGLYRFRHEQLFYYFYAHRVIEEDVRPVDMITRIAGCHIEGALVWLLRLLCHRRSPKLAEFLREVLVGSGGLLFYEKAALLDEMQAWSDPSAYPDVLEVILEALTADSSLEHYFFRHLAGSGNPSWFDPLREQGAFDTPPEPIEREGEISYPRWPAIWYLTAIAPKLPEKVVGIAREIRTQNPLVMLDMVRAAQAMPPEHAAQMVPLVVRWTGEGMRVGGEVCSLAVHLARGEQWKAALSLVELILSPQEKQVPKETKQSTFFSPTSIAKADKYLVQAFIESQLGVFLEHRPLETLDIVKTNLEQALKIEGREDRDLSWMWRPAIEPHEQNLGLGIKDLLVDAATRALNVVASKDAHQAKRILQEYLEHPSSIFRRLAIHTIRLNPVPWPDLLENLFTDQKHLQDAEVYHEYWMLMHDAYGGLPASVQHSFIKRLLSELPHEPFDDEQYHVRRHWVFGRLWAIRDSLPSDEYVRVLEDLVNEYGEPDHPSFLSYSRTLVGSISPKTSDELSKMPPEDVLTELRREIPFDGFDEPTQEGLADALKAAVASTPQRFASIAPKLFEPDVIPPMYTYYALWGFREAWKEENTFDWEPVLELCDTVSRTSEEAPEGGEPPDMMPGYWMTTYASARKEVADLLEAGVIRDDHTIPREFLGKVRRILLDLTSDLNPSPEYECKWRSQSPFGTLDLALKVTRGRAIEALLQYALHIARTNAPDLKAEKPFPPRSQMEEEVKAKLEERLNKQIEPSLAVHSIFGKYLPNLYYLDKNWLVAHLEDIFLQRPEMSEYWEAAWDGYLFRGDFFEHVYKVLRPYYRFAIQQLALGAEGKAGSQFAQGRLARHLAGLYWRGVEVLEDDDSLVLLFFDCAPDEIRAGFIAGLGFALTEVKPDTDSEEWQRARALWEKRFRAANESLQQTESLEGFVRELAAFIKWVPHVPESLDSLYPRIELSARLAENPDVVELVKFLSETVDKNVTIAVTLLEELLDQDRDPWFWMPQHSEIHKILSTAMASANEEVRSTAVRVINLLGERGDERYRELLKLG